MLKSILILFVFAFVGALMFAQEELIPDPIQITPHVIATPGAVYPQARVDHVDAVGHTVCFQWLDAGGAPVDSGNSIAHYTTADDTQPPTDAELQAAIEAAAPNS